jgi:glycosyltransferase involved in cell wall biosynthesis
MNGRRISHPAQESGCSMRVMIISSLYGFRGGGAGIMAQKLARGLVAAGHQVSAVTTGTTHVPSVTEEHGVKVFRFRPLNLYVLDDKDSHPVWQKGIWQLLDIYNVHCAKILKRIMADQAPNIVHIHKMRGFSGAVWRAAAHAAPGRVIQTCHDYESMSPDGYLRGFVGKMALNRQWPIRGYELIRSRLSAGVSVVTAPSTFTLNRIAASGLFPLARKEVVWNTHGWSEADLKALHVRPNVGSGITSFLFLGRLEREKGILELCEAFLRGFSVCPSMQLKIAGWGGLERQVREKYGRHPGITFLGPVEGQAKEMAIHDCAAVVMPSLWDEVFGVVTVEAFAFGKPVIASNVGGLPELVRPGETGWLVKPGDADAWATQLCSVAEAKPDVLNRMSQNCREYSHEFTAENMVGAYLEIYRHVMN